MKSKVVGLVLAYLVTSTAFADLISGDMQLRDAIYLYGQDLNAKGSNVLVGQDCDVFQLVLDVESGYTDIAMSQSSGLSNALATQTAYPDRIYDSASMFAYAMYQNVAVKTFSFRDKNNLGSSAKIGTGSVFGYCYSTKTNAFVYLQEKDKCLNKFSDGTTQAISSCTPVSDSGGSTISFPLQAGFKTLIENGLTKSFTVSGTCTGSGSKSSSPAKTPATFEGVAGLSATSTFILSLTNCTPASTAQTSTSYFDNNYVPLGFYSVGVNYGVYLAPPNIPTSVTVGGTGIYGTQTLYTNNTKSTVNGTLVQSYVIEAGTSTTAIVNLISKMYNASGTLTATEQNRYRIDASGTLTPVSFDIQYANGSTTHLVGTF